MSVFGVVRGASAFKMRRLVLALFVSSALCSSVATFL